MAKLGLTFFLFCGCSQSVPLQCVASCELRNNQIVAIASVPKNKTFSDRFSFIGGLVSAVDNFVKFILD